LCGSDDELAMVMGHELAHTVLDHCAADYDTVVWTTIASSVLISILDPTGFGSFLYEMFGVSVSLTHVHIYKISREKERGRSINNTYIYSFFQMML
jgi:Zn-dependent protease with chaperone function